MRRVSHFHRRRSVLQYDPDRPRGHRHDARRRDEGRRGQYLGRREHVQGQRHRALLSLRPARQPEPAHLQALARSDVHRRAWRPSRDVGVHAPGGPALPHERREGVLDRLEHARGHARSQGSRASQHRHHDRRTDHGRRLLARRRCGEAGDRVGPLRRGPTRGAQRHRVQGCGADVDGSQPHRRQARPRDERPDREPDHRGQEPGHLRSARDWRCSSSPTSGSSPASTTRTRSSSIATTGAASAGCSIRVAGSIRSR